jgi:hypothetical protein
VKSKKPENSFEFRVSGFGLNQRNSINQTNQKVGQGFSLARKDEQETKEIRLSGNQLRLHPVKHGRMPCL